MKYLNILILLGFLTFLCACAGKNGRKQVLNNASVKTADLIIHSADVYLVDSSFSKVEALVITSGKITDYGSSEYVLKNYKSAVIIDGKGLAVYPGFIDAHCHFLGYGLSQQQVDLTGTQSYEEVLDRVIKYADSPSAPYWITGRGWDHTDWELAEYPDRSELDSLFPDRPVVIRRIDGHALLANKKALELAGFSDKRDFKGGSVEYKNGTMTGILIDEPANDLISKIPPANKQQRKNALKLAEKNCIRAGLTAYHDAGLDKSDVLQIMALAESEQLKMYGYLILSDTRENLDYFLKTGPIKSDKIFVNAFKFYADGALGSRGACLLQPYSDVLGKRHFGTMINDKSYYTKWAGEIYNMGFQMCTHCIGDSANRVMLDVYSALLSDNNDRRWRIEHAQVINPKDFKRFGAKNIIPSIQPTHAVSDMKWSLERLGRIRIKGAYAYKELLEQNGWLPLGTDFPVEDISPLRTFYAAITRKELNQHLEPAFQKENALTRQQALMGITVWAAKAGFEEHRMGRLEKGYLANLTILDTDIMTCPEDKIPSARVVATLIDGEIVYSESAGF